MLNIEPALHQNEDLTKCGVMETIVLGGTSWVFWYRQPGSADNLKAVAGSDKFIPARIGFSSPVLVLLTDIKTMHVAGLGVHSKPLHFQVIRCV